MMNRRVLLRKGILRLATVLASIVALGLLGIVVSAGPAPAQSPSAYLFSGDADAYSANVPWPTNDPNTGIVEAVDFCNYTYSNVEQLTVNWLNGNDGARQALHTPLQVRLEPVGEHVEANASSTSHSAVARRFVEATEHALGELLAGDLSELDLVALMVDGVRFGDHVCVVAMGIDVTGRKRPLSITEGDTENTTVVKDLLVGFTIASSR